MKKCCKKTDTQKSSRLRNKIFNGPQAAGTTLSYPAIKHFLRADVTPKFKNQGVFHPMMGTVLMLFFGLPDMIRSL